MNPAGYSAIAALFLFIVYRFAKNWRAADWRLAARKIIRRRKRLAPALFFIICAINFLGGLLSPVTMGDTIAYRLPRVMHWLSEGRWHWIHTGDERMNVVATNVEFLWAPIMMLCKQDWVLFPLIFLSYLFLPGLIFSFFKMVGVRGRVAWWWMWLLPGGFVFAMQAASTATDAFSAAPALAAVVFALKGVTQKRIADLWISILAYGFMTGVKQVTLPLSIIWIVPMLAGAKLLLKRPIATAAVTIVGIAASALPIAIANTDYTGNWKGFAPGNSYEQSSAFWGVVGNIFSISAQNLQPPLFPMADRWNAAMTRFVQTPFGKHFDDFEAFAAMWRAPSEMNAGLGFALFLFLFATAVGLFKLRGKAPRREFPLMIRLVHWTAFVAALAFMAKSALMQNARYMAPYYPFLLPALLALPANSILVRRRWWRVFGLATLAITIGLLAISRQRPLIPPQLVDALAARMPENRFVRKVYNSFAFSRQGRVIREALQKHIPPSAKDIGYSAVLGFKEFEIWRSAPGRKVTWITINDDASRARNLDYVVVEPTIIETLPNKSIEDWLAKFGPGEVVGKIETKRLPEEPPQTAYIVKMPAR